VKSCPICHSTYPSDFAVCPRDATTLVEAGPWAEGTQAGRSATPEGSAKPRYDVFISYRRETGAAEARLLRSELTKRGVSVFLDVADLRKGFFDEALLRYIAETPSFLVVLTPHALDRCSDPDDWLRREIREAVQSGKDIIPVLMPGFTFPREMPDDIRAAARHQGLSYSHEYFDDMLDRIIEHVEAERAEAQRKAEQAVERAGGPSPGTVRLNRKDGLKYVWIPPGSFEMGCSPGDNECFEEEKLAHHVAITKGFWLGQTPVTAGAYQRFASETGRPMPPEPKLGNNALNPAGGTNRCPSSTLLGTNLGLTVNGREGVCRPKPSGSTRRGPGAGRRATGPSTM